MYFVCPIGKLYATGGRINHATANEADMIEVANHTGTRTALPPMQVARSRHAMSGGGSFIFAFGGWVAGDGWSEVTSSCEFYDIRTNR